MADIESNIDFIATIFPDSSRSLIKKAFLQANKNAETAIDLLLAGAVTEESHQPPLGTEEEDADALLARQLQDQMEKESKYADISDVLLAKQLEGYESDEELARRLEQQWNVSYNQTASSSYSDDSFVGFDLKALDTGIVNELLSQLKSSVIPLITEEIKRVEIPPIEEEVDTGKAGGIKFGVKNIGMDKVTVLSEKVSMVMEALQLNLAITDIAASMKEFEWSYEKDTFPKLKDNGKGTAGIRNCTINATFAIGVGAIGPTVRVTSCLVNIEDLDLKISGSKVSVIYNLLLSVFKGKIKKAIENALSEMITGALNENMSGMLNNIE